METIQLHSTDVEINNLKEVNSLIRAGTQAGPVRITNAGHLHGLGAGLKEGVLNIEGDAGDYLGALNAGAKIEVDGNAGNYAADNMNSGEVIIHGSAGFGAAEYCYGGTVVIYKDAGDFTGTMNKGATIIIQGDVGDEVGTYMLSGKLVIVGNAGFNLANYLIRGTVFLGGETKSLGHNAKFQSLEPEDITYIRTCFAQYGIEADPASFRKIVAVSKKPFYN